MISQDIQPASQISPFLRLPPEIRLSIYEEALRVPCWEKHQALETANALQKERSNQCPVCRQLRKEGGYLYPPCRLVSTENGYYITGPCVRITRSNQRINRTAILRTCRVIYKEAVDVLYDHTALVVLLASKHHFSTNCKPKSVPRLAGNFTTLQSVLFARRIKHLYLRIAIRQEEDIGGLLKATSELFAHVLADRPSGPSTVQITECRDHFCFKCRFNSTDRHALEALVCNAAIRCRFWVVDGDGCARDQRKRYLEVMEVIKGAVERTTLCGKPKHDSRPSD